MDYACVCKKCKYVKVAPATMNICYYTEKGIDIGNSNRLSRMYRL